MFNFCRKFEFFVVLVDYFIKCFDIVIKELVSWMRGYELLVFLIFVYVLGKYVIIIFFDIV